MQPLRPQPRQPRRRPGRSVHARTKPTTSTIEMRTTTWSTSRPRWHGESLRQRQDPPFSHTTRSSKKDNLEEDGAWDDRGRVGTVGHGGSLTGSRRGHARCPAAARSGLTTKGSGSTEYPHAEDASPAATGLVTGHRSTSPSVGVTGRSEGGGRAGPHQQRQLDAGSPVGGGGRGSAASRDDQLAPPPPASMSNQREGAGLSYCS